MIKKLFQKIVLFVALMTFVGTANAHNALSDSSFASLITCGPGNDYYLAFGHTAIRVCDPANGIDRVYNYGTFDFDTPNLYWNFIRGYLNYCVSASSYRNFVAVYSYEGRSLSEQRLRLTPDECRRLFDALEDNCRPENRFYLYDFFRDNCATRARDMIANALEDRTVFAERTSDTNLTFRQMIYPYVSRLKWWQFGVDMLLGMRCDRPLSTKQYTFIPFDLAHQLDTTVVSGSAQSLAEPAVQILRETKSQNPESLSPDLVFWLFFALVAVLSVVAFIKGWKLRWLDIPFFAVVAILSVVLIVMWFGTIHWCTKWNLNILWLNPLFLYIVFRLRKSNRIVLGITLLCLATVVIGFAWLPQQFNTAVIPIALALATRLVCYLLPKHDKKMK